MAPIPMNSNKGNNSLAIPALNSVSIASVWTKGRLSNIAPKPMGSSREGSISFLMARKMSTAPMRIIRPCCQVKLSTLENRSKNICMVDAPQSFRSKSCFIFRNFSRRPWDGKKVRLSIGKSRTFPKWGILASSPPARERIAGLHGCLKPAMVKIGFLWFSLKNVAQLFCNLIFK